MELCVSAAFSAQSTEWRQVVVQTCKMLPYRIRRNSVPLADPISRLFISSCFLSFLFCVCLYLCGADRFLTVLRLCCFCIMIYDQIVRKILICTHENCRFSTRPFWRPKSNGEQSQKFSAWLSFRRGDTGFATIKVQNIVVFLHRNWPRAHISV